MKRIVLGIMAGLVLSCGQENQDKPNVLEPETVVEQVVEQSENFDWLIGKWKRLNDEEGQETFENWEKVNETEYKGLGFTMVEEDTIKQENIVFKKSNEQWDVIVSVPNDDPVTFNGTSHSESEFVVENPENDFPNTIKYWMAGEKMMASVSNSEMEILFEFERIIK